MKRRSIFLIMLCLIIILPSAASASAESAAETAEIPEWDPGFRLSIMEEYQLMDLSGMDGDAWFETLEEMKQAGLSDPISEEKLLAADATAAVFRDDGQVYQIEPGTALEPVADYFDACRLAWRLVELLGGSSRTEFCLKSKLTMNGTTVYSFQQICDGLEVLGGVLKIAVNENSRVTGIFAGIDPEAVSEHALIGRTEAEEIVILHCEEEGLNSAVMGEVTERLFRVQATLSENLNMDIDADPIPDQLVWVVYTPNEKRDASPQAEEYPYLAHYVKADGEYLFSLPVRQPSDTEARCGFRQQELFAGLQAGTYTGVITDMNGNGRTVTVPVMYSPSDSCWYLGDVERRIAFADFAELAYGENHEIVMLRSENNTDWDSQDIFTFYNYLRARDFYAAMGWNGPDGKGTDELILKGVTFSDGTLINNAFSGGQLECWQVFAYSSYDQVGNLTYLTNGLDVMAHEYTHTFTATVMNQNLYENDLGAINEAMSDILGNLVEYICSDTDDTQWLIGENAGEVLRNMSRPETLGQPSSVWGMYFVPRTNEPNTINDRGGVHYNSSLLNLIAAELCLDHGMKYEEAVSFWVMTALGLTPRTNYYQIGPLLTWAMKESPAAEAYADALASLIEQTRIHTKDQPETLSEGQMLIRLVLPDTEAFHNKDWLLILTQRKLKTNADRVADLAGLFTQLSDQQPDEDLPAEEELPPAEEAEPPEGEQLPAEGQAEPEEASNPLYDSLVSLIEQTKAFLFRSEMILYSWEEMDTGVISLVVEDLPTFCQLYNISDGGSKVNKIISLNGDRWYDVTELVLAEDAEQRDEAVSYLFDNWKNLFYQTLKYLSAQDASSDEAVRIVTLPTTGLESIRLDAAA